MNMKSAVDCVVGDTETGGKRKWKVIRKVFEMGFVDCEHTEDNKELCPKTIQSSNDILAKW